jgi:hypothetical protein
VKISVICTAPSSANDALVERGDTGFAAVPSTVVIALLF